MMVAKKTVRKTVAKKAATRKKAVQKTSGRAVSKQGPLAKNKTRKETVDDLIKKRKDTDLEIKKLQQVKSGYDEMITGQLEAAGVKTLATDHGKATIVAPVRVTVDSDKLKKMLTAAQWKKITVQTLDKSLLEDAVVNDVVKSSDVAACSEETPTKPYLKVT